MSTELRCQTDCVKIFATFLDQEVQGYYEDGMRVPDDVTLLWADDDWGNIRHFPTVAERNRTGGAGTLPVSLRALLASLISKSTHRRLLSLRLGKLRHGKEVVICL